ncbi:hypothetical protein AURDEDRAFT_159053 [Auricularia subglabra TFB-10046 SS5]|nr:hypothetical protein AURDEDRAFT_159053 [Auricularia subglabra TFB-10046 SS5]
MDLTADCLGSLNQARPDLSGCFSLSITRASCRIWWSDAAGLYATPELAWDDPATVRAVFGYVDRLYNPLMVDPSISLADVRCLRSTELHGDPPAWLIRDDRDGVYHSEAVISVGPPWSRKGWVVRASRYKAPDAKVFVSCSPVVIKDSFPTPDQLDSSESAILAHIHADGVFPGVSLPIARFLVSGRDGPVQSVDVRGSGVTRRTKCRLILDGTGEDLYRCRSVLQFLMTMYDVVEVLRRLHQTRRVLQRDISLRNVLCATATRGPNSYDPPGFIRQVLSKAYPAFSKQSFGPMCVLIDYDNASCEPITSEAMRLGVTGTAPFVSCAVSSNFEIQGAAPPGRICALTGNAQECYIQAHGQARYDELSALHDDLTVPPRNASIPVDRAIHGPRHDVESCCWLSIHFLTTALPAGANPALEDKWTLFCAQNVIDTLERHRIGARPDYRITLMSLRQPDWAQWTHPRVAALAPLLGSLCVLVDTIYDLLEPQPDPYHLHEAVQRLLLREICRMLDDGDDIPLDVSQRRRLHSIFHIPAPPTPRPSKRKRLQEAESNNPFVTMNAGSSSTKVRPAGSPATSRARSNFLRATDRIVELSLTEFVDAFFRGGLSSTQIETYAPLSVLKSAKRKIPQQVEKRAYMPICELLNGISERYCGLSVLAFRGSQLILYVRLSEGEGIDSQDKVVFVDHSSHPPCRHPHPYIDKVAWQKPDIVALKAWLASIWGQDVENWTAGSRRGKKPAVAWHHIISAIEAKGTADNQPLPQAATYAGSVMQSRPDLGGCFGLAVAAQFFRLVWSDSSAVYATPEIRWGTQDATLFLAQYVHFLHRPPIVDPTIVLAAPNLTDAIGSALEWHERPYAAPPQWKVYDDRGHVYLVDYLLTIGEPWTRKNWVVRSTRYGPRDKPVPEEPCPAVIIKDSFLEQERLTSATESAILNCIHGTPERPHTTKGVMTKIHDFIVLDNDGNRIHNIHVSDALASQARIPRRTKYRILLHGSATMSLYHCDSVQRILMAVYDVLAVLRHVHEKYDILHKDVSPANLMMYPDDFVEEAGITYAPAELQPVFIRQLLAYKDENPEAHNHPTCLLIDFDNASFGAADTDEWRTGTPSFIARTVSAGKTSDRSCTPEPITELKDDAMKSYVRIFGQKCYDDNCSLHRDIHRQPRLVTLPKFVHRPWHDAESCYWVTVHSLMLALPRGADPQTDDTTTMTSYFSNLDRHQIGLNDCRKVILTLSQDDWAAILHNDLHGLAPFLRNLQDCLMPDRDVFSTLPPTYSMHEAMQRLFLQEIWRLQLSDPIPLEVGKQRILREVSKEGHSSTRPTISMKTSADLLRAKGTAQERSGKRGGKRARQRTEESTGETDNDADEPKARKDHPHDTRRDTSCDTRRILWCCAPEVWTHQEEHTED